MKTIYKINKFLSLAVLALVLTVATSLPSFAVSTNGNGGSDNSNGANFCTRVPNLRSSNENAVATKLKVMKADFSSQLSNISQQRKTTNDQKLATIRSEAQVGFEAQIKILEDKAGLTETQKTAIATFKTDMEQAQTTRKTAVNAARTTYRTALTETVQAHQSTLTNAANAYQTAVQTAFAAAKTDCANGPALGTLRTSIKTARQTLTASRANNQSRSNIQQLMQTRNTAIKTANQEFAKTAAALGGTLTEALKSTDTTTTP